MKYPVIPNYWNDQIYVTVIDGFKAPIGETVNINKCGFGRRWVSWFNENTGYGFGAMVYLWYHPENIIKWIKGKLKGVQ